VCAGLRRSLARRPRAPCARARSLVRAAAPQRAAAARRRPPRNGAPRPNLTRIRICPQIYKDFLTGEEYFSDAKKVETVMFKDESGAEVETGLVRVRCAQQTAGGVKIDVGGGSGAAAGFGGEKAEAGDDDDGGADDQEVTKIDQFWTFPSIENEQSYPSFKDFQKNMLMPFLVTFQKLSVLKGVVKDEAEMKAKGKVMAGGGMKWLKANFDSIQFFGLEAQVVDGSEVDAKFDGQTFVPNVAYLKYDDDNVPWFYFFVDAFKVERQ
jgi:hypothetical protein